MEPTIYDVAQLAGVSISTVSRVLNSKDRVKKETEDRIREAIKTLGFQPNITARSLAKQNTRTIGVYYPSLEDSVLAGGYFLEYLRGVEQVVAREKYHLLLINEREDNNEAEPQYISMLQEKRVDGLLVSVKSLEELHLKKMIEKGYSMVYVGERVEGISGHNDYAQLFKYTKEVLEYLYEKGHREIAVIFDTHPGSETAKRRAEAYREFCQDKNIKYHKDNVINLKEQGKSAFDAALELLSSNKKCTALFTEGLKPTQQIISAANTLGLKIPQDLSLICTEYAVNEAEIFNPELTSVLVPAFEMGKASAELLFDLLCKQNPENNEILFDPVIVQRNSVADI